jgi:hypothetical protein
MRTYNSCGRINAELLLVSRINCTMWIHPCPLVLVVNIDDAAATPVIFERMRWLQIPNLWLNAYYYIE